METKKITIHTTVSVNIQKAWEYYTQPEHITKWNFATDEWQCPYASNDLRVGGKYMARMEAKDGSFGFDFEGIYDEVIDSEKIIYTMSDGRQVTVSFESADSQTEVTVTFDAESTNDLEIQRQGWQAILENYKRYTEAS
ncbi:SRPBCC family protein [Aquiflexum sp.]|uniref:SRPBCC family protein n=1 Tax=Aquiflexum sp. TaxID=1872584 RepID=UPI003593E255